MALSRVRHTDHMQLLNFKADACPQPSHVVQDFMSRKSAVLKQDLTCCRTVQFEEEIFAAFVRICRY